MGMLSHRVVPCGDMDVVLVIDTTGSMSRVIEDVKVEARALLDLIDRSSAGRFRLGLVTFDKRVAVHHDLDSRPSAAVKKAAVMASIQQLRADGGGSGPEASDEALNTIINRLAAAGRHQTGDFRGAFRGDTRIIILITDALPGGFDDAFRVGIDDENAARLGQEAAALHIRISPIYVNRDSCDPHIHRFMYERYARPTAGILSVTGAGASFAIRDIVHSCGTAPIS